MSNDKNILVDIWLVSLLADRLVSEMLDGSPLGVEEFALYGLIVDLAPVTAADLARGTGLSATTLSGILSRCERRGELERIPNPDDRRSSLLQLTERGGKVYLGSVGPLRGALDRIATLLGASLIPARIALASVDGALRALLHQEPRPYVLEYIPETSTLGYGGPPLTSAQVAEVRRFIAWLRHRDV
jgi:DNA-binding MarR family transcriptional regulator